MFELCAKNAAYVAPTTFECAPNSSPSRQPTQTANELYFCLLFQHGYSGCGYRQVCIRKVLKSLGEADGFC